MRITIKYLFLFSIAFNLLGCLPATRFSSTPINNNYSNHKQTNTLIHPYKIKLDAEMNEVLVISANEFPKEKGKPETKLGNLVADLSFEIGNQLYQPTDGHDIDFCLLNFGGLRTSLPKGEITRGKIFELMPFENELVVVTISLINMKNLTNYLKNVGGQPIGGGYTVTFGKEVKISDSTTTHQVFTHLNQIQEGNKTPQNIKVLTSDYLANGGDNMNFFLNPIKTEPVGIKLRDAIIQYCREQNKQGKQLVGKLDGRITFEK